VGFIHSCFWIKAKTPWAACFAGGRDDTLKVLPFVLGHACADESADTWMLPDDAVNHRGSTSV